MIRTQISLTEPQMARLRDAARRRGVSIAAVVRSAVESHLDEDPDDLAARWERMWSAVGAFRGDDPADAAVRHDDHVADAIASDKLQRS